MKPEHLRLYEKAVRQKHRSDLVVYGFNFYGIIWYYSEFFLAPEDRRPFTYILRDFWHKSPVLCTLILASLFYSLGRWWIPVSPIIFITVLVALLAGILIGHLGWGTEYVPGQQEYPTYLGLKEDTDEH